MSTVTANSVLGSASRPSRAILRRLVWKEYRMLRGLWLAVFVMAAIVQWAMNVLMPRPIDHAMMLFSAALAAAVLYAVGAAATTFSVEHEEETYGFLAGLPTEWWPIFAGKLLVVAASAALLAAALSVVGWILYGYGTAGDVSLSLGIFGIAILEAIAWGTLFSLLVKRPLLAAILTLVVGGGVVNAAVNLTSERSVASTVPEAYIEAMPARSIIVCLVFACSAVAARNWLNINTRAPVRTATLRPYDRLALAWQALRSRIGLATNVIDRGPRRRMLLRLLWQTWRESWKFLLLPILVAAVLWLAIGAMTGLSGLGDELTALVIIGSLHFVPALFGAMAFHADQRRESYRFLAEHAARPGYVWFSRHIVWLGALVVLYAGTAAVFAVLAANGLASRFQLSLHEYLRHGPQAIYTNVPSITFELVQLSNNFLQGIGLALNGALTAYAIGQLCSMLLRSEILAAFLAIVMSVLLSAWIAALFVWQLSGWLFLLPLAVGLFAVTWLRSPNWIAGRNEPRTWWKPALAMLVSLAMVGVFLPVARLAQVPQNVSQLPTSPPSSAELDHAAPPLRQTADEYIKVAERLAAGPQENLLASWESPELTWAHEGALEVTIPLEQLDEFREAEKKQLTLMRANLAEAVAAAVELSKRPACHFDFHLNMIALYPTHATPEFSLGAYPPYKKLTSLNDVLLHAPQIEQRLAVDSGDPQIAPDKYSFIERATAALRMSAHLRNGQPSVVFIDQLRTEREILGSIGNWAQQDGRTEPELRDALTQLDKHVATAGHSIDADGPILADAALVREVITGNEPSLAQALEPKSLPIHLAYLANKLPWERERALRALDRITNYNLHSTRNLDWNLPVESWVITLPQAATSYLARFEYLARNSMRELQHAKMNTETLRRATLLRIAIALYRLEHGKYPPRLQELAPGYLKKLTLLDPYSSQPFQYQPHGLDLPLDTWGWGSVGRVERHTPMFWSVGPTNLRLTQGTNLVPDPQDEGAEGRAEQRYMLIGDDLSWRPGDMPLVFPLAKADDDK
jgi:hypothetical protein